MESRRQCSKWQMALAAGIFVWLEYLAMFYHPANPGGWMHTVIGAVLIGFVASRFGDWVESRILSRQPLFGLAGNPRWILYSAMLIFMQRMICWAATGSPL